MSVLKVGRGRSEITITGTIAADLTRQIRDTLGPVGALLEREAARILRDEIRPNWPVKTGDSLDGWSTALRVQPGTFIAEAVLFNPHVYVRYIKSGKRGEKRGFRIRSPLIEHVRRPVRRAAKRVKREIPILLGSELQKGLRRG